MSLTPPLFPVNVLGDAAGVLAGDDGRPSHQDLVRKRLLNELVLADVVMLGDHTRQFPQLRAA